MSPDERAGTRRSRRRLSRERIVDAALASIETRGVEHTTMRRLGPDLQVEAMALYRYVSGREDLLEAVVVRLLEGLVGRVDAARPTSWQQYLQLLAHEIRDVSLRHPAAFPLVVSRHPATPWLRPPLRDIETVEHLLATLTDHGFDDGRAVDAYKAFTSFLVGYLLLEVSMRVENVAAVEEPMNEGSADIPEQDDPDTGLYTAPHVLRMRELLSQDRGEEEFEIGLEMLLNRIEQSVSH
ncbi:TetR/AcrR family transcriptional regulator C-terminal domain-containing protein [Serinicoccus kebangsaanensis]|uniref:TetR/AcrR family transcriptional regulator C-terminal domain-containing protein n=1 Tax=Serinicoccus kebangsaanensis TaxID=2602069 RepID=UPI00124C4CA8|nr:TetR/AcrR family transcriptional regulator C-terminal domain-containing protein [Serinicoccus kebangsaanensis]